MNRKIQVFPRFGKKKTTQCLPGLKESSVVAMIKKGVGVVSSHDLVSRHHDMCVLLLDHLIQLA